jgi:hypothetical protein
MRNRGLTALAAAALMLWAGAAQAEMNPHFEALKPLLGRTWRGHFKNSTPEKPVVDVSRFELALGGQAVRNRHSVNDGEYAGESFIVWDETKQSLVYYYFTTAGFHTTGTMRAEGELLVSHEMVAGAADGITEVRGTFSLRPDGRLHVQTQYLKNGAWVDGRDMDYVDDPQAVVRLKE